MFLIHFKLASQPFAERVAADALWQDDRMRQGLAPPPTHKTRCRP